MMLFHCFIDDLLLMNVTSSVELHKHLTTAADYLTADAIALYDLLAESAALLEDPVTDADTEVHGAADTLKAIASDLIDRVRLITLGGSDMNAGLAALEHLRNHFQLIETQGVPCETDGRLSRRDLEWARDEMTGSARTAATWLLAHSDFFDKVETAKGNDSYLAGGYERDFHHDDSDSDGLLSLEDIDAFVTKATAWATLLPLLGLIDTAAEGGAPDSVLSREDFKAFLAGYKLSPNLVRAVDQVLDDRAHNRPEPLVNLNLNLLLDAVSFVPVIGDLVDMGRALYYTINGDYLSAAIYALGMVPIPGLSGSGARQTVTVSKKVFDAARTGGRRAATATAVKQAKELREELAEDISRAVIADVIVKDLFDELDIANEHLNKAGITVGQQIQEEYLARIAKALRDNPRR